jgi:SMC interacting uncharacterized protein involved in chromosome segregation
LCPRPLDKKDYHQWINEYITNSLLFDYENHYFIDLSEKWNKNPDISDNFITFLKKEYEDRLPFRTADEPQAI